MTDSSLPKYDSDSDFGTHDGGKVPISHAGPPVWTSSCGAARSVEEPEPSDDVPAAGQSSLEAAALDPKPAGAAPRQVRKPPPVPAWLWLLAGGAAAGTVLLIRHLRRQRKDRDGLGAPVRLREEEVFLQSLRSLPGLQPPPAEQQQQPLPLSGRLLVVSDRCAVQSIERSLPGFVSNSTPIWCWRCFGKPALTEAHAPPHPTPCHPCKADSAPGTEVCPLPGTLQD